jgi:hypothetical protein
MEGSIRIKFPGSLWKACVVLCLLNFIFYIRSTSEEIVSNSLGGGGQCADILYGIPIYIVWYIVYIRLYYG